MLFSSCWIHALSGQFVTTAFLSRVSTSALTHDYGCACDIISLLDDDDIIL